MTDKAPSLLDEISAGLGIGKEPSDEDAEPDESTNAEDAETEEPAAEETSAEGEEAAPEPGEPAGEGEDGETGETADATAGEPEAAPAEGASQGDEVDVTPPAHLREKARERWQELTAGYNKSKLALTESNARAEAAEARLKQYANAFEGYEPEALAATLNGAFTYQGALDAGDYATAERLLLEELRQVSILSGRPPGHVDLVAEHPDLSGRVAEGTMQPDDALSLALARLQLGQLPNPTPNPYTQVQPPQAPRAAPAQAPTTPDPTQFLPGYRSDAPPTQEDINAAAAQVNALADTWKSDPDWSIKQEILVGALPDIMQQTHHSQWVDTIKARYATLNSMASAMAKRASNGATAPRPLSGSSAQATAPAPKSMQEAIFGGLGLSTND